MTCLLKVTRGYMVGNKLSCDFRLVAGGYVGGSLAQRFCYDFGVYMHDASHAACTLC